MDISICYNTSYVDVAYTIRGDQICRGTSYVDVAYTIRGDQICHGTSYVDVAYTIREDQICRGTSYVDVAYTIRGDQICRGTSYVDVAYTIRSSVSGGGSSSGYSGGVPEHGWYFPDYGPWNLKKTICLLITLIIQAILLIALATGKINVAINESIQSYIIVNVVMFANALVSGILCKIAFYRIGSILSTIVNVILGIYIFVTAISSMEGIIVTVLALLFFGFIEYWVVYGGYLISSLFCKKYY